MEQQLLTHRLCLKSCWLQPQSDPLQGTLRNKLHTNAVLWGKIEVLLEKRWCINTECLHVELSMSSKEHHKDHSSGLSIPWLQEIFSSVKNTRAQPQHSGRPWPLCHSVSVGRVKASAMLQSDCTQEPRTCRRGAPMHQDSRGGPI